MERGFYRFEKRIGKKIWFYDAKENKEKEITINVMSDAMNLEIFEEKSLEKGIDLCFRDNRYPSFGEMDSRFIGTSLEKENFFYWGGLKEKLRDDVFNEIKEEALNLVKVYDKYKDKVCLSYPAYYVKGKNGPYYESICFQPNGYEECDYSYYEGVYAGCSIGHVSWNKDNLDIDIGINLNSIEKEFIKEIEDLKT